MPYRVANAVKAPFDLYDFFGYLFPGAFFAFGLTAILLLNGQTRITALGVLEYLNAKSGSVPLLPALLVLALFFLVCYVLGHFVASFASLLLEKFLLKGAVGYPFTYYLRLRDSYERRFSESLYRIMFVLINACLVLGILSVLNPEKYGPWYTFFLWSCVGLLAFRFVTNLVKFYFYKRVEAEQVTWEPRYAWFKKCFGWLQNVVIASLYLVTKHTVSLMIGILFRPAAVLDEMPLDFVRSFRKKFDDEFHMDYAHAGTNVFWLSYVYVMSNCSAASAQARNFLHMYSFSRNMAAASLLLVVSHLVYAATAAANQQCPNRLALYVALMVIYVVGIVLLFRYFYLYCSYFTKFLLRAFVVGTPKDILASEEGELKDFHADPQTP